jgi:hypothetical protein
MPHWQGLAWLGEPGTYGIGLRMLAIPNYILFMLLIAITAIIIECRVTQTRLRRLLITAVMTWLLLEILRWFATISNDDPTVPFFNWELLIVLAISLSALSAMKAVGSRLAGDRKPTVDKTPGTRKLGP